MQVRHLKPRNGGMEMERHETSSPDLDFVTSRRVCFETGLQPRGLLADSCWQASAMEPEGPTKPDHPGSSCFQAPKNEAGDDPEWSCVSAGSVCFWC